MNMTTENKNSKNKVIPVALFAVYAILTLIGAARHELWFDEAQAWTIARDNDIGGIFEQIHYEGHPPLWYMILFVFSRLGFSCNIMPFISWFVTGLAAAIVMFKSPFSTVTKALLIFSGGFLYFNSVISRTYCLINLFFVLIAILFTKRKEHPVIFGILVALLANTHVFVSGFIGAMGLIMLHDIYSDWKTNSTKKNILNLTGLAIAGIGVLMLIIPLIGSLGSNSSTQGAMYSIGGVLGAFTSSFQNISMSMLAGYMATPFFIGGIFACIFVSMIILMRHKTRPMLILTLSNLFYIITTEIFWRTIPNRAHMLVFMYFITMWIAETEPENKASAIWDKFNPKTDTKLIKSLLDKIKHYDLNFNKSYKTLLCTVLVCTIPVGVAYMGLDYVKSFSPSKQAAELIRENLPEDAILVCAFEPAPEVAAYLPEYQFYSYEESDFCTYDTHINHDNDPDNSYEIYNDLKDYENLYLIRVIPDIEAIESGRNIIFTVREYIPYGCNAAYIEVSTFDAEKEIIA